MNDDKIGFYTMNPDKVCEKCKQWISGGTLHVCPKGSLLVENSDHILIIKQSPYTASFQNMSWRYTLLAAFAFMVQPIAMPIMIIMSKALGRSVDFWKAK